MTSLLARYHTSLIATLVVVAIGIWPMLLAPLGRVYVAVCARYLTDAPVGHHYPPLVVAFLAPIIILLLVGLLVALGRQGWRQHRLAAAAARYRDDAGERFGQIVYDLELTGRLDVTHDRAAYAFCGGLIRPRIYLSRGLVELLTTEELEAVLRHERHHLTRRDPLRYFLTDLLERLAPFFPILTTMGHRVRITTELAADQAALRAASVENLASALVKVMRAGAPIAPQGAIAALSATDARVAALLGGQVAIPVDRRDVVISLGLALIMVVVVVWLAFQPLPLPPACRTCTPF